MTAEEQRKLLESLGLLDNLKTINLMDLLRHRKAQNEMKIDLSELDKYLDGRISEERKEKEKRMAEVQTPHIQEGRRRPTLKNVYDKHMKRKGKFIQVVEDAYEKAMNPPTPQRQGSMSKSVPKRRDSASISVPKSASNQRRSSQVQFGRKSITTRKPSFSLDQAAKTARLALVSRNPNEKPKAKELFPGKSKTWIQNHFMKLGLLPNSILAGEIEGEAKKKERLEKEKKAAAAIQAMQEAANKKAMADRVKNVRRSNKFLSETVKYMQSEVDLGDDGEFEEEELPERPALKFDDAGPEPVYEDLEEIERKRREAEEAERLQRLAEEEEARRLAAELEAELRAQRERDEAEIQAKKDEQERLKREKAEAEEAERLRLKAEKEARRKAELDAKLAVKRAKKEAMDAIMMAKKAAEAEEAERRKRLEDEKRKAAQPSTTYGAIKDFVPVTDTEKRTIVAQDVFSAREKGTLYKAPPPPTIKKSERKPIVPWKRRPNDQFEGLNKIGDDSNSDLSGSDEEEDDFDPEALTGLWDNANEDVAKTAWNLIDISKKTAERKPSIRASTINRKGSTGKADDIKQELKNIIGNHWFPGLDPGMEANLQNILKVLFKTMKSGLWREKSEACKAVLYLYQTFEKDFQDPLNVILVPQLEFFNDNDWQFRATLCAVLPVYKQSHPDLTYHLISCLKDKSDVVRRTAKKSLTEMGINSKESLRQAMVQLQIIPDVAQKQKELSFLDEELARLSKNQSDYDAINAARIVEWQKLVPLKKIPGSLKDRPDSYNATLVKKGVLTKEDFEKMYGKNNQPKPAALAPACEPDERMSTQRSRTVNNLGTIVKPTIFSQLKVQSAMPSRRPSFDKYWPDPEGSVAPSKTGSARNSIYRSSVYGQSSRKSSIYERSTSMKENSQEKLDHRDEEEDDFLTNADIPRISLTRRPSLGGANRHSTARQSIANNITFNNGALQKPTPKTDFFDKPTSEEELRVQKDQYLVSRRTTGTFAGGFRRNSQASPSRPGFGGWGTLRSSIMAGADAADPWGLFKKRDSTTSDESTPKSSRRVSHFGPIVSSHLEAEEKIEVDVDGAIKVYSRRVSMQPLQVSYYKRINIKRGSSLAGEGMLPEDENNLGISLPPVVSVTKTESDEKINQRASRGSMDKGVPIVTVRMKTPPDESAIRPNRIIEAANNYTSTTTIPSAGTGSRRNTITASTTLFDPNSRPWTVDDQQERQKTPAQRKSNANDFISPIRQDSGKRDEPKAWSDHDSVVTSGGNDHT
ncbi:hypothetical protein HDU79_002788 [Rhizoclosmatium sp. JEL0117]|nr:hypothetical protein HDU79_002788 [Rhizoclosmatium sp. JEL0117]